MKALEVVERLVNIAVSMKVALDNHRFTTGEGLEDFLRCAEGRSLEAELATKVNEVTDAQIQSAIASIQKQRNDFLQGRLPDNLTVSELTTYHALLDTENALVLRGLSEPRTVGWWSWLVNEALPVFIRAGNRVASVLR